MARQEFTELTAGDPSLLRQVELIVLDGHRGLYLAQDKPWSEPIAYHWLHYEDAQPVARLADGLRRLLRQGVEVPTRRSVSSGLPYSAAWGDAKVIRALTARQQKRKSACQANV